MTRAGVIEYEIPETPRQTAERERRERVLALPQWTLMKLGWEIEPGRVQGGIWWRVSNGLGPTGRDTTARQNLDRAVMWHDREEQPWGIQVLATPA